jgi:two-component system, cell cycle sensor histidine kinase and response regulator CckA
MEGADAPRRESAPAPHVFVVDDDAATLRVMRIALERIGYNVTTAESGDAALELLEDHCPDALVADLMMPGTSGEDLARLCAERCPDTKLLFVSGYDPEYLRTVGITQAVFIPKPVSLTELQTILQQMLGR